jgi:hypothetical protein
VTRRPYPAKKKGRDPRIGPRSQQEGISSS